jgi:glycyl-tRNA synthetase beta chain
MAVSVEGIPDVQPPVSLRHVGPPAKVAFDDKGAPTPAALGFARSKGVPVESLRIEETDKGPYVVAIVEEPGKTALDILPALLRDVTAAIPFPKSMRWEPEGVLFGRPIRWLVALLDDRVLPLRIAGITAGRATFGHPFLSPGTIDLPGASFEAYLAALNERCVVADIEQRRNTIRTEINAFLEQHGGELTDLSLLDEVTNMVEYPHAVEGSFDEHFLDVPSPVLSAAMREHQRYFPVCDAAGRLMSRFVTVSNRTARQDELVRQGNERVLLARLDDAKFFWDQDRRRGLEELVPRLAGVVFLGGLGNNLQRTERLVELAGRIADAVGPQVSRRHVQRAARLCKADLLTGLVTEFPVLQGVVGRELARVTGEPAPVAEAIAEHYLPAGADDALPTTLEGTVLALADKLDVILGCFSLGLLPSGSQDPYALRRNALGILLIMEGKALSLRLGDLIEMAREVARRHGIECDDEAAAKIKEFFRDRLYHAAMDRGFRHDFVRAVLSAGYDDVVDFWSRLSALAECAGRIWWPALVELVDRTYRIQRDAERIEPVREDILQERLELELAAVLKQHHDAIADMFERGQYVEGAELYCSVFAQLVHDFFEEVFVNVEDGAIRLNRKSLCAHIYRLFADRFADLYLIERAEAAQ